MKIKMEIKLRKNEIKTFHGITTENVSRAISG